VTITAPADGSTFYTNETITFTGTASDPEDGDLSASISWTSNLQGSLGSGASLSTTLSEGTHTITAEVTDSGGLTASGTIEVTVEPVPNPALKVTVTTNKPTYTAREKVKILVNVTDGSDPVAGASVSVTVTAASGNQKVFTGVTDGDGNLLINYRFNVRKDDYGTYTVFALATLSGYDDDSGTTTFEVVR
jgi:hypothetical protein